MEVRQKLTVRHWSCQNCGVQKTTYGSGRNGKYCSPKCRDRTKSRQRGINKIDRFCGRERRKFIQEQKLLSKACYDCGWEITKDNLRAFDWDHVNPMTKSFELSAPPGHATLAMVLEEIKKCQVVCRNCHALRDTSFMGKHFKKNRTPEQMAIGGLFEADAF
jgi:hypothetical protein